LFGFSPLDFLYTMVALLAALTVHESAHALVADRLGDPTGRKLGRISLNPIRHLDPTGTLMMLMSSFFGVGIGWGKPVPVNPANFRGDPKRGMALVSAAGPGSNFLFAALLYLVLQQAGAAHLWASSDLLWVRSLLAVTLVVNIALAFFNLIPLPPLDGFAVLLGILPNRLAYSVARVGQYGPALLLLLVFFGGSLLGRYLGFFRFETLRAFQLVFGPA